MNIYHAFFRSSKADRSGSFVAKKCGVFSMSQGNHLKWLITEVFCIMVVIVSFHFVVNSCSSMPEPFPKQ